MADSPASLAIDPPMCRTATIRLRGSPPSSPLIMVADNGRGDTRLLRTKADGSPAFAMGIANAG